MEIETLAIISQSPAQEIPQKNPSNYFKQIMPEYKTLKRDKALDREAELLEMESELGKSSRGRSSDEISYWVCDLER